MKFIDPPEIASKIMTLMDSTQEKLVIISPYNKVAGWKKLEKHLKSLHQREIEVEWYIRKRKNNDELIQLGSLGFEPIEIENLHAKIYFNEQYAIISSKNLHYYSDENSLDTGYMTETQDEYNEILTFYKRYILNQKKNNKKEIEKSHKRIKVDRKDIEKENTIDTNKVILLDCLKHLKDLGNNNLDENIKVRQDRIEIKNFYIPGVLLQLENKNYYFRIIYSFISPLNSSYRNNIYSQLRRKNKDYNAKIGIDIDFGNQMKRLKFKIAKVETNEDGVIIQGTIEDIFNSINKSAEVIIPEIRNIIEEKRIPIDYTEYKLYETNRDMNKTRFKNI